MNYLSKKADQVTKNATLEGYISSLKRSIFNLFAGYLSVK